MKKIFLLLCFAPFFGIAQYFSGEIVYEINIIPKSDTIDLKVILDSKKGTKARYLITSKRYKSTYFKEDTYQYSYTYDNESQRMFDDYSDRPYITFRDSRRSNAKYFGSKIYKDSTKTILGYDCYMVRSESEFGISKRYYSDDVRVNYRDFEGHKVGNWYNNLKEVNGAITIKTITEYKDYIEIQEAVEVNERKVKIEEFDLADKPVAASITALDKKMKIRKPTQKQIQCYQQKIAAVSKDNGEKFISYIKFLLSKDGKVKFIEPHKKDSYGFYKIGMDIVRNCGFEFESGKINGKSVDTEVYFPITFFK